MLTPLLIAAVVGYFLGALPFGYLVARMMGINIFEHGSKNPGATNVRRVCGKGPGNLVFALDALKGAAAVFLPFIWSAGGGPNYSLRESIRTWVWYRTGDPDEIHIAAERIAGSNMLLFAVVGLAAALIGHSFSCFTKFKGGKGVATASGGFLVLMPLPLLCGLGVWLATFYTTRYVSLASMLAAIALPIAAFFFKQPNLLIGLAAVIAVFVALRHRSNIGRLLKGTEPKFVKKPADAPAPPSKLP